MSDATYPSERLMARLDGARLVRYDTAGLLYAWFGGHGVHVYDASGAEVDYWNVGDFAENGADVAEVEQSMARRMRNLDEVLEQAEKEGYEAGKRAGSWLLDGNSSEQDARRLLDGIEAGDPEILDQLPSSPLSGEWAGDLLLRDVLESVGLDEDDDGAEDVLRAYEDAYCRGVEDEAVRSARAMLPVVREGYPHPIAYTYDAATHCPVCASYRFGVDADRFIPEDACDSEGNPVGAIAPWDEWQADLGEPDTLACATCGGVIEEYDPRA